MDTMSIKLFTQNAFPPESNIFPGRIMRQLYGPSGLQPNERDKAAKAALQCIIRLYREISTMDDGYEIAMMHARVTDLKQERIDYVEHCWLHNRYRRS